jgi:hypothetical protein
MLTFFFSSLKKINNIIFWYLFDHHATPFVVPFIVSSKSITQTFTVSFEYNTLHKIFIRSKQGIQYT